jgi:hypothetical protein
MKGRGQALLITLDTALLAEAGSSAAASHFEGRYLVVTYMQGKQAYKMGTAVLACVQGCRCSTTTLTLYREPLLGVAAVQVSKATAVPPYITSTASMALGTARLPMQSQLSQGPYAPLVTNAAAYDNDNCLSYE